MFAKKRFVTKFQAKFQYDPTVLEKSKITEMYTLSYVVWEYIFSFTVLSLLSAPASISGPSSLIQLSENKGPLLLPYNTVFCFHECCWSQPNRHNS